MNGNMFFKIGFLGSDLDFVPPNIGQVKFMTLCSGPKLYSKIGHIFNIADQSKVTGRRKQIWDAPAAVNEVAEDQPRRRYVN